MQETMEKVLEIGLPGAKGWKAYVGKAKGQARAVLPATDGNGSQPSPLHFSVRRIDEEVGPNIPPGDYLIAANVSREPIRITFRAPTTLTKNVEVLGEEKTLPVNGLRFDDTLAPLGVVIYRLGGKKKEALK